MGIESLETQDRSLILQVQDIFKKEVELAAVSEDVAKLAPKAHDRFESCVPIDSSSNMLDVTVQRTDLNQSSGLGSDAMTCNDDTDVALFWPKDTAPFYEVQCCPAKEKFCAGCAKMNSGVGFGGNMSKE
ncbi:unnamed protein product [Cladocopium goreaui]|uniref:Uncharacterized protein n=1 Tax=Cladocopium goreaui TaxID=2562237 RepID=A0A9P1BX18_9DINO|nr:unnamed protein product [Cladocopium goreaui]